MEVGSRVRDKNNNSIGIIERQNLTSYLVAFEGGRKLWRKAHELEPETKVRASVAPKSQTPQRIPTGKSPAVTQPQVQAQPQQAPQQAPQRAALGGGGGTVSPVLGRAPLGATPPASQPKPAAPPRGGGSGGNSGHNAPPQGAARPSLGGGGAAAPPSPQGQRNTSPAPAPSPIKAHHDSGENKANNNGSSSTNKGDPAPKSDSQEDSLKSSSGSATSNSILEEMWNISFDELEFGDVIGSGKFGEVYLGTYLGTPVAIKKILESDEDTKLSIERELLMLKNVRHPNIVQFLGLCQHKGDIFFVTEYMDRGDLFDLLFFADTPLTWKLKMKIALDVAMPCYYLQAKTILHRDLKSQNILVSTSEYKAKLCDLGLARALDTASRRMTFVGTDRWMAPEICLGIDYDYKVDVFSYGVVLMEIITQSVPDERRAQDKFAFNEAAFRSKVPKSCPPAFAQLAIDCTKLDPRTRPSFKAILDRVRKMYEDQPDDE